MKFQKNVQNSFGNFEKYLPLTKKTQKTLMKVDLHHIKIRTEFLHLEDALERSIIFMLSQKIRFVLVLYSSHV